MPLSFIPKKAEAQIGISGYTSGLAPAIASLPQCKEVINSGIKSLFSGIGNLFLSEDDIAGNQAIADIEERNKNIPDLLDMSGLDDTASSAASSFDNINVFDTEANKKLDALKKQSEAIKQSTESLNANSTCIQSIGRLIIKMLLQKLTVSTVAWINSGFDGNPAFIQDPGRFFNDIAKNEILQFGLEIDNPELFPFGRAWMQNTALAFNNKFQDNARYSLNELIQSTNPEFTAETFQQDFSQGGWNAWTAMTQVPANNPLGFKLMADNEIQRRLAGTTQSTAEQVHEALSQADGFLGDMRCVDPEGMTKQQSDDAIKAGNIEGICKQWEYVTPGKLVSEAATNVMGYQNNAYLNVEDLNDAVAAILDALLSQFSSNIMEKGFANFGNEGADGSLVYDSSRMNNTFRTQTEKDFMPSQLSSSWLAANPNFNIRTDLTQALIDEQRTYSDKLKLQNQKLMSTTDGQDYKLDYDPVKKISNADGLIPVIYQLDYCIPGPHPGFEEDSRRTLAAVTDIIVPESPASLADRDDEEIVGAVRGLSTLAGTAIGLSITASTTAFGASLGSVAPVVGTIIGAAIGFVVGWIIDLFSGEDGFYKARLYYATQLGALTGIQINPEDPPGEGPGTNDQAANIESKYASVHVLNTILDRYIYLVHKVFNSKFLPDVTREATTSYYQITGYNQMAKNNEEKISLLKTTVNLLGDIKDEVDKLNADYPDGGDEYESKLKPQINAFGRLSSSMVNGNDIAKADNLLKQIIDKKDYIYKNLLKGPYGCEKDLELRRQPLSERIHNTKRMTYPFPILYDYNNFGNGESLPDPLNMMGSNVNKMKSNYTDNLGPGFLSYFIFQTNSNESERLCAKIADFNWSNINGYSYQCELEIGDLLPMHGNPMSLGRTSQTTTMNGPFETVIGVY